VNTHAPSLRQEAFLCLYDLELNLNLKLYRRRGLNYRFEGCVPGCRGAETVQSDAQSAADADDDETDQEEHSELESSIVSQPPIRWRRGGRLRKGAFPLAHKF